MPSGHRRVAVGLPSEGTLWLRTRSAPQGENDLVKPAPAFDHAQG
jgi:hypothetical protein